MLLAFSTRYLTPHSCTAPLSLRLKNLDPLGRVLYLSIPVVFLIVHKQKIMEGLASSCTWMSLIPLSLHWGRVLAPIPELNYWGSGPFCILPKWWGYPSSRYLVTHLSSSIGKRVLLPSHHLNFSIGVGTLGRSVHASLSCPFAMSIVNTIRLLTSYLKNPYFGFGIEILLWIFLWSFDLSR